MIAPLRTCTLSAWRLRHAPLSQAEAADRAGITPRHASAIESSPGRATVGALASYVQACGGKLECIVEIGGLRRLLVLLAMVVGCGGSTMDAEADQTTDAPAPSERTHPAPVEPAAAEPQCGLVISPTDELSIRTTNAAARWAAATGCDVRVGEGGVPVFTVDALHTSEGKIAAGHASHDEAGACSSIEVWLYYSDAATVPHEIGHCLGAAGHSPSGLMTSGAGPNQIDAASLALVCASAPCLAFNPERSR
jgi:hypothetical protein